MMRIGAVSDLHSYNKTLNIEQALSKLNNTDILLIVGDIADRADEKQYDIFLDLIREKFSDIPYIVFPAITTIPQETIQTTDSLKENSTASIFLSSMNAVYFTSASDNS